MGLPLLRVTRRNVFLDRWLQSSQPDAFVQVRLSSLIVPHLAMRPTLSYLLPLDPPASFLS